MLGDLRNFPAVINYKNILLSVEWIQDHLSDEVFINQERMIKSEIFKLDKFGNQIHISQHSSKSPAVREVLNISESSSLDIMEKK